MLSGYWIYQQTQGAFSTVFCKGTHTGDNPFPPFTILVWTYIVIASMLP